MRVGGFDTASGEVPIRRVLDAIAELQSVSGTVPVEVWVGPENRRCRIVKVLQMTPSLLREMGLEDFREEGDPMPTVLFVAPIEGRGDG